MSCVQAQRLTKDGYEKASHYADRVRGYRRGDAGAILSLWPRLGRQEILTNTVIVIENGRIKSVGTPTDDAIDMSRYTA